MIRGCQYAAELDRLPFKAWGVPGGSFDLNRSLEANCGRLDGSRTENQSCIHDVIQEATTPPPHTPNGPTPAFLWWDVVQCRPAHRGGGMNRNPTAEANTPRAWQKVRQPRMRDVVTASSCSSRQNVRRNCKHGHRYIMLGVPGTNTESKRFGAWRFALLVWGTVPVNNNDTPKK